VEKNANNVLRVIGLVMSALVILLAAYAGFSYNATSDRIDQIAVKVENQRIRDEKMCDKIELISARMSSVEEQLRALERQVFGKKGD